MCNDMEDAVVESSIYKWRLHEVVVVTTEYVDLYQYQCGTDVV
jgi:hypothetical protein